jgi:hypothetical protein
VLLDGPEIGGPMAITGSPSPEGELATDACGDSARGGSAFCSAFLGSERTSVVRDLRVRDLRDIDMAGAFVSGSTLLSDVDGGVLLGRGRAEPAPRLSRRFRFVSWAGISSSHAANLF